MKKFIMIVFNAFFIMNLSACSSLSFSREESTEESELVVEFEVDPVVKLLKEDGSEYRDEVDVVEFDKFVNLNFDINYTPIVFYELIDENSVNEELETGEINKDKYNIFEESELLIPVTIKTIIMDNEDNEYPLIESWDGTKYLLFLLDGNYVLTNDYYDWVTINNIPFFLNEVYVGISLKELSQSLSLNEDKLCEILLTDTNKNNNQVFYHIKTVYDIIQEWTLFKSNPFSYYYGFEYDLDSGYVNEVLDEIYKNTDDLSEYGLKNVTITGNEYIPADKELSEEEKLTYTQLGELSLYEEQLYTDENNELQKGMGYMFTTYSFEDGTSAIPIELDYVFGKSFLHENGYIYETIRKEVDGATGIYWVIPVLTE